MVTGLILLFVLVFGVRLFFFFADIFWVIAGKLVSWGAVLLVFYFLFKVGAI